MTKPSLGIGVLSWRAHKTLIQSLESYAANGFLEMFDEKVIYFSDISDEDRVIAQKYGWDFAGGPNAGIAVGMKKLAQSMSSDYIILLQNDNPICEDKNFACSHINEGFELLKNKEADIVRLRHLWKVGEGFADVKKYCDYYAVQNVSRDFIFNEHGMTEENFKASWAKIIKRILRPQKAKNLIGRSVFVEENPDDIYPQFITRKNNFFIIDSGVINFTDQCLMISRDYWLDIFCDYVDKHPDSGRSSGGFPAPERSINGPWWRNSHFKVAQGQGVFTHDRFDGSFREGHKGFEKLKKPLDDIGIMS
jgi:hypothetical protein